MSREQIQKEIARLKDVLAEEKQYLLSGRVGDVAALMNIKLSAIGELDQAFGTLEAGDIPADFRMDMQDIAQLARENSVHFEAIQNGLQRAIRRLESLHADAHVGSYAQDGTRMAFTEVTGRFLKKA
jgi:lambda repressor-like predicted transcriptional regulator